MINLRYFASLRDQLACDAEQLDWQTEFSTVADIKQLLSERNSNWGASLSNPAILVAVNQQMGTEQSPVSDGDEIAFFPPVTGG